MRKKKLQTHHPILLLDQTNISQFTDDPDRQPITCDYLIHPAAIAPPGCIVYNKAKYTVIYSIEWNREQILAKFTKYLLRKKGN